MAYELLIVEDEFPQRFYLSGFFSQYGFVVTPCSTLREARQRIRPGMLFICNLNVAGEDALGFIYELLRKGHRGLISSGYDIHEVPASLRPIYVVKDLHNAEALLTRLRIVMRASDK